MLTQETDLDASSSEPPPQTGSAIGMGAGAAARPWSLLQNSAEVLIRSAGESYTLATGAADELAAAEALNDLQIYSRAHDGARLYCTNNMARCGDAMGSPRDECPPPDGYSAMQFLQSDDILYLLAAGDETPHGQLFYRAPQSGKDWQSLAPPTELSAAGRRLSHITLQTGFFCAVIDDDSTGIELWRTPISPDGTTDWSQLLSRGAFQHNANARTTAVYSDGDHLLLATAATEALARHRARPVRAELLLVTQTGDWAVVIGSTRITPDGLAVPLGALGRGFGTAESAAISAITHTGEGYLVTCHGMGEQSNRLQLWFSEDLYSWAPAVHARGDASAGRSLLALQTGCGHLYATVDMAALSGSPPPSIDALPKGVVLWSRED